LSRHLAKNAGWFLVTAEFYWSTFRQMPSSGQKIKMPNRAQQKMGGEREGRKEK
jgi:hypothetical protein